MWRSNFQAGLCYVTVGLLVWEVLLRFGFVFVFSGCPENLQRDELKPPSAPVVVKRWWENCAINRLKKKNHPSGSTLAKDLPASAMTSGFIRTEMQLSERSMSRRRGEVLTLSPDTAWSCCLNKHSIHGGLKGGAKREHKMVWGKCSAVFRKRSRSSRVVGLKKKYPTN